MKNKSLSGKHFHADEAVFLFVVYVILVFALIAALYPIYYVLVASVSDPVYANSGELLLYPKGLHFSGYTGVLTMQKIWAGYYNTLIYTVFGTTFGLCCSLAAGYSLSRSDLPGRNVIMLLMVFTMFFSGGMIPTYLIVRSLGLTNTRIILIILGSISVYNIILIRTYFSSTIPGEMKEAAFIDGCGNMRFFLQFALPLSKAIVAVIALYIAVYHWNAYFNAFLYITDRDKLPLQVILRELLSVRLTEFEGDPSVDEEAQQMLQVIRYSVIVVSTLPVMCLYPFVQKYFVKGIMIGSLKG
jgi:putative aldouronate transport system permease protein